MPTPLIAPAASVVGKAAGVVGRLTGGTRAARNRKRFQDNERIYQEGLTQPGGQPALSQLLTRSTNLATKEAQEHARMLYEKLRQSTEAMARSKIPTSAQLPMAMQADAGAAPPPPQDPVKRQLPIAILIGGAVALTWLFGRRR